MGSARLTCGQHSARPSSAQVNPKREDLEQAPYTGALRDNLLRVSRLADDLPQVAELDLNPVIVRADGVIAVDARTRVTSEHLADPFLRQLPH